jgi:predicted dehydrogenase
VETDPEAIFADAGIDAVCIGTWPYRHRDYVVRGAGHRQARADRGAHGDERHRGARDARGVARPPELVAQIVPAPLDLKSWRTIRRLVDDGSFGELREVHVSILTGQSLDPETPAALA